MLRRSLRAFQPKKELREHASFTPKFHCYPATTAADLMKENDVLGLMPKVKLFAHHRPTPVAHEQQDHWRRKPTHPGNTMADDFTDVKHTTLNPLAAVTEAQRCLKCADAPCQHSCPTTIDIKHFIQQISTNNFYGAAKTILSDNPVGLSCGHVCPTEVLCVGGCNMHYQNGGPINIGGLQAFTVNALKDMNIPQTRDPAIVAATKGNASYKQKIALVGGGPASVSCATYLARLGYTNIDVFDKHPYAGGLSASEIPQFRLPIRDVLWEVRQLEDLGVKFHYSKEFGKDVTVESLKKNGYETVFFGIGLPGPNLIKEFKGLTPTMGFYTSKTFLPPVCETSKQLDTSAGTGAASTSAAEHVMPDLKGKKVLVLGAGDTAFDCACSAFRCGADRVIVTFRRSFADMKCVECEFLAAKEELTEFLPYCQPKKVLLDENRTKLVGLELYKMEKNASDGTYSRDEDQVLKIKCDVVISAFGSEIPEGLRTELAQVSETAVDKWGKINIDRSTGQVDGAPAYFAGGDCSGGTITVEAANDGKTAAWSMHKYLQALAGRTIGSTPQLPNYHTEVDEVDLSTEFCGIRFPNPIGIASATNATSAAMIGRSFDAGFGFAITKTFSLDKDLVTNVSPRIIRGSTSGDHYGPHQGCFMNIELISEKTAAYWCSTIRQLKHDYPDHPVIASVMAGYNKEDWQDLMRMVNDTGCEGVELNLSCPHGMGEKGMGLACGQSDEMVETITRWCVDVAKVPVFPKMTPNITEVATIARAAHKGGATGVCAVNTVSSLMDLKSNGEPWPAIGEDKGTTFGGMSGNANRPIALRAVSSIATKVPELRGKIMATGGASSADNIVDFLHCGAGVVQICSAIQNQDFSIVSDYITGLKTHLYMRSRPDLANWNRQHPPQAPHPPPFRPDGYVPQPTRFGAGLSARWAAKQQAERERIAQGPAKSTQGVFPPPPAQAGPVPSIKSIVGKSLEYVGTYTHLSQSEQVTAVIDEDVCINCGRCYMTCADSAYQAIEFDEKTHYAHVNEEKCTGCGLCLAVCPIPECISMEKKQIEHVVERGVLAGEPQLAVGKKQKK